MFCAFYRSCYCGHTGTLSIFLGWLALGLILGNLDFVTTDQGKSLFVAVLVFVTFF